MIEASGLLAHYRAEKDGAGARREPRGARQRRATASCARRRSPVDAPMLSDRVDADAPRPRPAGRRRDRSADRVPRARRARGGRDAGGGGPPALQLMTVHSAKGLEFHTVFVTGLEEGLFPHENSLNEVDGLEEERRLMYVAITRARRRLYLTHAQSRMLHGQTRYNIASRFLDEMPRELVQWLSPQRRRRARSTSTTAEWGAITRRAAGDAAARRRGASARACATPSSASASSSTPRAAAATRACRSTSATRRQVARARVREAGSAA